MTLIFTASLPVEIIISTSTTSPCSVVAGTVVEPSSTSVVPEPDVVVGAAVVGAAVVGAAVVGAAVVGAAVVGAAVVAGVDVEVGGAGRSLITTGGFGSGTVVGVAVVGAAVVGAAVVGAAVVGAAVVGAAVVGAAVVGAAVVGAAVVVVPDDTGFTQKIMWLIDLSPEPPPGSDVPLLFESANTAVPPAGAMNIVFTWKSGSVDRIEPALTFTADHS